MPAAAGRRTRVLVVEDHEDSRLGLMRALQKHGHEVRGCATVAAALGELITWLPECVVLDLMLPDGLGVQILRNIREHRFPVRVGIVTAAMDSVLLSEVDQLQPNITYRKPVHLPDLLEWIEHR